MGKNNVVTYATAEMLKQCGYTEKVWCFYAKGTNEPLRGTGASNFNGKDYLLSAPTYQEAIEWLWDTFGVWVSVDLLECDSIRPQFECYNHFDLTRIPNGWMHNGNRGIGFKTPGDAADHGIISACGLIIKKLNEK